VDIDESPLRADQRPPRPAIDLVFAPRAGLAPRDYFGHLAITYAEFCSQLRQVKGSGGSASRPDDAAATDLLNAVHQFYDTALSWHCTDPVAACTDECIAAQALRLHAMNFGLWHHEDAVRRPGVGDREVARRKRAIDDLNARRNAAIENIDATRLEWFDPDRSAPLHTETPAMIVDRLSVLTLRILHTSSTEWHGSRLAVLEEQYDDLIAGLE